MSFPSSFLPSRHLSPFFLSWLSSFFISFTSSCFRYCAYVCDVLALLYFSLPDCLSVCDYPVMSLFLLNSLLSCLPLNCSSAHLLVSVYLSLCLSSCLLTCLSLSTCITPCLSAYPFVHCLNITRCVPVCLSASLSTPPHFTSVIAG